MSVSKYTFCEKKHENSNSCHKSVLYCKITGKPVETVIQEEIDSVGGSIYAQKIGTPCIYVRIGIWAAAAACLLERV